MGVATGISLLSYIEAEIYDIAYVLPVMAAIFDLPITPTSDSIHTSLTVLLDPNNVRVATGIVLRSHIEAEIYVYPSAEFLRTNGWLTQKFGYSAQPD